jgi:hypothetical protein
VRAVRTSRAAGVLRLVAAFSRHVRTDARGSHGDTCFVGGMDASGPDAIVRGVHPSAKRIRTFFCSTIFRNYAGRSTVFDGVEVHHHSSLSFVFV